MCYVIAKHTDFDGCVAFKTIHGEKLVDLKRRIEAKIGFSKIELITISRPSAYPEYGPYQFVETEAAFEEIVLSMPVTDARCLHQL